MDQFQLWTMGNIYKNIRLEKPRLASWNANADPEQIALQKYLDDIDQELNPLPQASGLFLHMEIDVNERAHLLHNHDLDNYLHPVVNRLRGPRFNLVTAIKRVGGGSYLGIGSTRSMDFRSQKDSWATFQYDTGNVSVQKPEWKKGIRDALKNQNIRPLKSGPVELQLVWKCSSQRNWVSLWKPTIDALGPILGEPDSRHPFNPDDGRITSLALHLNIDDSIGWSVQIGMMWRSATCATNL